MPTSKKDKNGVARNGRNGTTNGVINSPEMDKLLKKVSQYA